MSGFFLIVLKVLEVDFCLVLRVRTPLRDSGTVPGEPLDLVPGRREPSDLSIPWLFHQRLASVFLGRTF